MEIEDKIYRTLDTVFAPLLVKPGNVQQVKIIVGKGMNSKRLIQGKHPVKFYTEKYLSRLGFTWTYGGYFDGQEGTMVVNIMH